MRDICLVLLLLMFISCSNKKQLIYVNDINEKNIKKINYNQINDNIEIGDILKIDVQTVVPEAALPYNKSSKNLTANSIELLKINGYIVDESSNINFPVLGEIHVLGLNDIELALKIKKLLVEGGHLSNPYIRVRKINSKFTVLGEVLSPGTFPFYERNLNIFQALGFSGDLLITAKRDNIKLIREENGLRKSYQFSLTSTDLLDKPFFIIKNNDIIIVEPNFSKVKSAGFIGSPTSIASIASLILSFTLLIINR